MSDISELRLALRAAGYAPLPACGKEVYLPGWSAKGAANAEEIAAWSVDHPSWCNTGVLCSTTPALDIDLLNGEAARAAEDLVRELFDGRGVVLARFGLSPKRAIPFRTGRPFPKIRVQFVKPEGSKEKPPAIEMLAHGQQFIVNGIHPETRKPYTWHADRTPWNTPRADLPEIDGAEAQSLVDLVAEMLVEKFGFQIDTGYNSANGGGGHTNGDYAAAGGVTGALDGGADAGPVDVEAELAAMVHEGTAGADVNHTARRCIPSLLRKGAHPDDVLERIVDAAMAMAQRLGLGWDRDNEIKITRSRILSSYNNLLLKDFDPATGEIPIWLPGEFHAAWIERVAAAQRPVFGFNRGGFYIKTAQDAPGDKAGEPAKEDPPAGGRTDPRDLRFRIVSFGDMRPGVEPLYLIDELVPVKGLVDIWGKPKCFKSFVTLDMMLHVAMGWEYHDRSVRQGAVVYCAFEGAHGYKKRVEALRRHYEIAEDTHVPLYIMPGQANLIKDHVRLIADLKAQLGTVVPVSVVLDTLNKSLIGSESKDLDMSAYLRAAEAIRDAFGCVVIIVHHCGLDETRPRGHTSLPGAVDAQIAVVREGNTVTITVEHMRDGPEDTSVTCVAKGVDVGEDANGKVLTSLVMVPSEAPAESSRRRWSKALSLFHKALSEALLNSDLTVNINAAPVRAADAEAVRTEFYAIYVAKGETKVQQRDNRRQAFHRNVSKAQKENLIGVQVLPNGQTLLWLATADATDPEYNLQREPS